jgi:hypothetical protein
MQQKRTFAIRFLDSIKFGDKFESDGVKISGGESLVKVGLWVLDELHDPSAVELEDVADVSGQLIRIRNRG